MKRSLEVESQKWSGLESGRIVQSVHGFAFAPAAWINYPNKERLDLRSGAESARHEDSLLPLIDSPSSCGELAVAVDRKTSASTAPLREIGLLFLD